MDPRAVALVVTAAVCHAVWNLATKRAADGGTVFVWLNSGLSALLYLPLVVVTLILNPPTFAWWIPGAIIVTGLLHTGYSVMLQRGYRHGDLSVVYPLARGTGPALSVTFAIVVFGERPGPLGILGAATVIAGILVIGLGRPSGSKLAAGIGYGLLTGTFIASYTVWDAWVVGGGLAISPILYDWGNNLFRATVLTPHAIRRREHIAPIWRKHWRAALVVAVIAPAAYMLVLFAYRYAPVSLVAPTRELSIVIGSVLGWLLLREPQAGKRITGAVIVLAGVVALTVTR